VNTGSVYRSPVFTGRERVSFWPTVNTAGVNTCDTPVTNTAREHVLCIPSFRYEYCTQSTTRCAAKNTSCNALLLAPPYDVDCCQPLLCKHLISLTKRYKMSRQFVPFVRTSNWLPQLQRCALLKSGTVSPQHLECVLQPRHFVVI